MSGDEQYDGEAARRREVLVAKKTEVPITGSVLVWALDEAGLTPDDLAARLRVSPETVAAWIAETEYPGKTEFAKIIDAVRRPTAIFFMPQPPQQAGLPASFRHAPGPEHHATSPGALREMRKARRIQQIMSWLLRETDDAADLPAVDPRVTSPTVAGEQFREQIGVSLDDQAGWGDASVALRQWRAILDERNILAFSLQLGRDDIRGFSIWDPQAPIVAVNTAYNQAARIFTLGHELGHLVTRSESACYGWVFPDSDTATGLERWCERFSAAFLLPPSQLRGFVRRHYAVTPQNPVTDFALAFRIANRLKVSARALALSLIDLALAPASLYLRVDQNAKTVDRPRDTGGGGGGVPAAEKRVNQYGTRVSRTVAHAVADGALGLRDAADFLDVNLNDLQDISDAVLGAGSGRA